MIAGADQITRQGVARRLIFGLKTSDSTPCRITLRRVPTPCSLHAAVVADAATTTPTLLVGRELASASSVLSFCHRLSLAPLSSRVGRFMSAGHRSDDRTISLGSECSLVQPGWVATSVWCDRADIGFHRQFSGLSPTNKPVVTGTSAPVLQARRHLLLHPHERFPTAHSLNHGHQHVRLRRCHRRRELAPRHS